MRTNLASSFNKFAGREVSVTEKTQDYKGRSYTTAEYDTNDAAITEIRAEAAAMGLSVRVWMPNSMGTMDFRTNRLNVDIAKESDGKYRVQDNFRIG